MSGRVAGFAGRRGLKAVLLGALVASGLLVGAGPAAAHDEGDPSWRHHEHSRGDRDGWRHQEQRPKEEWRERQAWREREAKREHRERAREEWRRERWRERHGWYSGAAYGGPPAVVYEPAPPVVYPPPARGSFELSVNIPIR